MKNYGFNPVGVPILLGASGNSHEGGTHGGGDYSEPTGMKEVGTFYVEEWDGEYMVYYSSEDDDWYILIDGSYESIGSDGAWAN